MYMYYIVPISSKILHKAFIVKIRANGSGFIWNEPFITFLGICFDMFVKPVLK